MLLRWRGSAVRMSELSLNIDMTPDLIDYFLTTPQGLGSDRFQRRCSELSNGIWYVCLIPKSHLLGMLCSLLQHSRLRAYTGIAAPKGTADYEKDQWIVGLVTSMPYLASAFCGCWLSKPLNDWFGRRGCIFITGIILIAAPIGSAVSQTWPQLLITRAIMGLGMGAKGSTVPIFAAEHSPTRVRSGLTASWQLMVAFGCE